MKSKQLCTFYIVRHGESEGNVSRVLQGHSDHPLTEQGIKQAQVLAKKFSSIRFDHAFSSDLLRARRTAEIIALEHKLAITTRKLLRERTFGRSEGKPYHEFNDELKREFVKFEQLTAEEKFGYKFREDIESDEEIVSRFITFLREASLAYSGKTILVVSHGGMMRSLLIHLGYGSYETLLPGAVRNLGYFKLLSDGINFLIKETEGIEKER